MQSYANHLLALASYLAHYFFNASFFRIHDSSWLHWENRASGCLWLVAFTREASLWKRSEFTGTGLQSQLGVFHLRGWGGWRGECRQGGKNKPLIPSQIEVVSGKFVIELLSVLCPQTAPVQEECNGPIQSPKPPEASTNHTGSGNMALPLHIKTSSPVKCHFLSPLTCVAIPCPQTSASCHLSGGPFRDSSPPRPHQARLKLRYAAKISLTYSSLWPQMLEGAAHQWSAVELAVTAQTGASV